MLCCACSSLILARCPLLCLALLCHCPLFVAHCFLLCLALLCLGVPLAYSFLPLAPCPLPIAFSPFGLTLVEGSINKIMWCSTCCIAPTQMNDSLPRNPIHKIEGSMPCCLYSLRVVVLSWDPPNQRTPIRARCLTHNRHRQRSPCSMDMWSQRD